MRRRSFVTIALLAFLCGLGSVVAFSHLGGAAAGRSNIESASAPRVPHAEGVLVATRSVAVSTRTVPASPIPETSSTLSFTGLWLVLAISLSAPAGSIVRPTRRRRAPPLLVT